MTGMRAVLLGFVSAVCVFAQGTPVPVTPLQIIDSRGGKAIPCVNCALYTYAAGTTTPLATYTSATLGSVLPNPVRTNSAGYAVSGSSDITGVWIGLSCYKLILKDASAVTIWSQDQVCSQEGLTLLLLSQSSGSSHIGFIQSGSGAVVETVQSKLRQTVSVTDYGAKCDGSTDDSAAFNAAITAVSIGSAILVPSNNCIITAGVTLNKRVAIQAGAPSFPTATLKAGADVNMITITSDGSSSSIIGLALDANGHSGAKGIVMAGTSDNPVTNVTIDHVIWNGNFLDALTGTYNYFAHYKDTRVFGAQTGFALGPQANSQIMNNVSFQENQTTVANGINWTNSTMLTIEGLTLECGTAFASSNSNGALISGGYAENQISTGCAAMSTADGGSDNLAYVNFGAAFGGSPAYGNSVEGMLFNGSAAYGVKIGSGQGVNIAGNRFATELLGVIVDIQPGASRVISAATNATTPVFTVSSTPFGLESTQSVKISGFTGSWSTVNGTYVGTNLSSTTFSAVGVPDTSGFGAIAGSPVAQFYAVNKDMHIGPNSYAAPLTQASAIGFTASNADTTATNVSSLMATPFIATYATPAPQNSHLKPGYGSLYWRTTDGGSTTAGSWHGLWNLNGTAGATFPVTDLECLTTGITDSCKVDGNLLILPTGTTPTTPVTDKQASVTFRTGGGDVYMGQDDASGTQTGVANSAFIVSNSLQPIVLFGPALSHGSTVVCWKADGKSIGYATVAEITSGTCH